MEIEIRDKAMWCGAARGCKGNTQRESKREGRREREKGREREGGRKGGKWREVNDKNDGNKNE